MLAARGAARNPPRGASLNGDAAGDGGEPPRAGRPCAPVLSGADPNRRSLADAARHRRAPAVHAGGYRHRADPRPRHDLLHRARARPGPRRRPSGARRGLHRDPGAHHAGGARAVGADRGGAVGLPRAQGGGGALPRLARGPGDPPRLGADAARPAAVGGRASRRPGPRAWRSTSSTRRSCCSS